MQIVNMEVTIKCMQFTCFVLLVLHLQGNLATPSKGIYDYNDVLHKSNLFYEAQRSGYISEATNRIPYRASSALGDQGYFGENLTGGWYDGLNHVKHGLPMAASVTNLAWGMIRYKEAYIDAGEWEYALENIKWATDYFIRCHSDTETYYYQVGSTDLESSYWGRPEDMTMDRPPAMVNASFPGSDVTGETAAAMAASSILFQQSDPTYSTTLLQHARELFTFANTYRGLYPGQVYSSSDYGDELGLAACWLYYATNNISYIQTAEALYDEFNLGTPSWAYSVKNKNPAVQILLYEYNQDQRYQTAITTYMNRWLPGGNVPRTPKGLAYRNKWGTLRYAANTAFLALVAADLGINPVAHRDFAKTQIRYMLGDSGRSYVVGYGVNPPERPKHKASACPDMPNTCDQSTFLSPDPNPQILYGALVGGPDANDNWVDDRSDSKTNKVTCDFNAGFQSAVAGLKYLELTGGYDYIEVIHQSIRFYEAQRSGDLPEATNRIPYRSDSALGDQGFYGEDLTGGWYDSGDHVKFGQPMAASLTNLAWGMILFEDAYRAANAWDFALEGIRWVSDYFVKCHVAPESFYYQVGDGGVDHTYWGRPEEMTANRPALMMNASVPGSDIAGDTASALAAASIVFTESDPAYSAILLDHAEQLFAFANNYLGNHPAGNYYNVSDYGDEIGLAACWLYLATGNESYLQKAEDLYVDHALFKKGYAYAWGIKNAGVQVLLYQITGKNKYYNSITNFVDAWLPGGTVPYTPGGLVRRSDWGPLRYAANTAFIALVAAEQGIKTAEYQTFAKTQIHYMLGDSGHSYVTGYGVNPPNRPHHRSSSCPDLPATCNWSNYNYNGSNPQVLYGGLVGGPDINDYWTNDRADYRSNEVACDYNAGFQSAVAGLKHLELTGQM